MASFDQSPLGQVTRSAAEGTVIVSGSLTVINVTNSGATAFVVNGVSNPTLYLPRGNRYSIVVNAVGHPFWIQTVPGPLSSGNIYTAGLTNNGTDSGTILFDVPVDAPLLYYACAFHAVMIGSIDTSPTVNNAAVIDIDPPSVIGLIDGTPTWYASSSAVQSEGRRESKMVGVTPSPKA